MTQFPNDSLTALNSALQSLPVKKVKVRENWFSMTNEWSSHHQLKAAVIALLITLSAHIFWLRLGGYFGFTCFALSTSLLLIVGIRLPDFLNLRAILAESRFKMQWSMACILIAIAIACARMIWQGNLAVALATWLLLGMLSLSLHGRSLEIFQAILYWLISAISGFKSWFQASACFPCIAECLRRWPWAVWGIPIAIGFLFMIPLLFAHPAAYLFVSNSIYQGFVNFGIWLSHFNFGELVVLVFVAAMSMGLLLPNFTISLNLDRPDTPSETPCTDLRFRMAQNSLVTVVVVFVLFLVLEFSSLWFRSFPNGFDFSGYAHQGAAWLTVALAMATLTLSFLFSSAMHKHPELFKLQRLAKTWMLCNLFLAIAVYYRLAIYVNFNGLTRLRIVGFVGVTCVVAGFGLVLYRVMKGQSWLWLIHRQLWAFLISLFVLATFPLDWIAQAWNVRQIEKGNLASLVHFGEQPISDEGMLCLVELVKSPHSEVRDSIFRLLGLRHAVFALKHSDRNRSQKPSDSREPTWNEFQGSTFLLEKKLDEVLTDVDADILSQSRTDTNSRSFRMWAWQWY